MITIKISLFQYNNKFVDSDNKLIVLSPVKELITLLILIITLKAPLIYIRCQKNNKILQRKTISNTIHLKFKKHNKIKSSHLKVLMFYHLNMLGLKRKQASKCLVTVLEKLLTSSRSKKISKIGLLEKEKQKFKHFL